MMFRMFDQIRLTTHRDEHLRRRIHCKLRYKLRGLSFWRERK